MYVWTNSVDSLPSKLQLVYWGRNRTARVTYERCFHFLGFHTERGLFIHKRNHDALHCAVVFTVQHGSAFRSRRHRNLVHCWRSPQKCSLPHVNFVSDVLWPIRRFHFRIIPDDEAAFHDGKQIPQVWNHFRFNRVYREYVGRGFPRHPCDRRRYPQARFIVFP